jgi:CheY-like chemotaxis protein/anti-sigma regulatory factor (Ser/Thr protein kinase)
LGQVLLNLVGNAIKFTARGDVTVRVSLESQLDTAKVVLRFSIKDTGIGISPAAAQKLFQPFIQSEKSTARKFGGTGLGLSICKNIVALMGGSIHLESEEGKGSTFWFTAQFAPASQGAETAQSLDSPVKSGLKDGNGSPALKDSGAPPLVRGHVLVAEDNAVNQMVIQKQLQILGFTSQVVANGREALDAMKGRHFDLLLMDCEMPEMDGFEATGEIRKLQIAEGAAPIPIIALTAHALRVDQGRCMEAGMNAYVSKPVKLNALASVINEWMSDSSPSSSS